MSSPQLELSDYLAPADVDALAAEFASGRPTRHVCMDDFLHPEFARRVASAYPTWDDARKIGRQFHWVNEDVKVQVTDSAHFAEPIRRLHEVLASREFLDRLTKISGIPGLVADPRLDGGGLHVMGPSGHLGVHVDFNMRPDRSLHRRLNLILYLSDGWQEAWGGEFELWDPQVREMLGVWSPVFNRCVLFNTTTESFHGVRAVRCPIGRTRNSFAAYYYTHEPPPDWDGKFHDTIYKPRPGEWWKAWVQMPLEALQRGTMRRLRRVKHALLGPKR
jgi:Rps23 Pro-64 3,4-dihydroxylase Tpa1-like proline 4-hydroxylase